MHNEYNQFARAELVTAKQYMSITERMPAKFYHQFAKTLVFVKTVHRHERSRWAPTKVLRVMSRVEKGVSGGKSVEDEY